MLSKGPIRRLLRSPNSYGEYGLDLRSGIVGAGLAADSEIFHFRWTAAGSACLVKKAQIWAGGITAFTAGFASFRLFAARAWTVDGTGGATATLTGNNHKLRTGYPTTALGTARVATTAALGAGTKTLDAQALSSVGGSTTAVAGTAIVSPAGMLLDGENQTLILEPNEGFSIVAAVPATGTWLFGVSIGYEEVALGSA